MGGLVNPDACSKPPPPGFAPCTRRALHDGPCALPLLAGWTPPSVVEESRNEIDKPPHYTRGEIEPIDVIEDWKLDYHLGNVLKYIARAEHKGSPISDLRKARWYLTRALKRRGYCTDGTCSVCKTGEPCH